MHILTLMPFIHVYTGDGEGKTAAAIGIAIREVGHGKRAIVVQFLKGRKDVGEVLIAEKLAPLYEIHQFGTREFVDLHKPSERDRELAKQGLEFVKKLVNDDPELPLLVLDEINLACSIGLLVPRDVLAAIEKLSETSVVILTGRNAPREFLERADQATEFRKISHVYDRGVAAREGREY